MAAARKASDIPPVVISRQVEASDPGVSAWVTANAGSGKTHVLAQRVIRLLLDGVKPEKILCITFTKAAAANMSQRVFRDLAAWIAYDDARLDRAIREISNKRADSALRDRARRLFATALETPGGLKVQTIHAFCTKLLHQFPFEANVAARFNVLDDASESQLLSQIRLDVLLDAAAHPDSVHGRALATAIATAADQTFKDVITEAIRKRDAVRLWIETAGGIDHAIGQLCHTLGIATDDSLEQVEREIVDGPNLPSSEWPAAASILRLGSSNDEKQANRLDAAHRATGAARLDIYLDIFLTGKGEFRSSIATAKIKKIDAALCQRFNAEKDRLSKLLERRRAVTCRDRSAALLVIADAVITRYQAEKDRRGLLDYDDLIDKARAMLTKVDAGWVHYKLDRGIDHVLIDEAQDTSPKQWDIIRHLTGEFFAGAGAREVQRTIFAVGDEKQSIFSFQGAAPHEFDSMRREFEQLSRGAERVFRLVRFGHSFRSGATVLGAVDTVFAPPTVYVSVTTDAAGMEPHEALPGAAPGLVEIWPPVLPDDTRSVSPWDAPFDAHSETTSRTKLAGKIARYVGTRMGRGARPGDVLVLVRQRGALFEEIIRALKTAGIAVAGADRLVLTEHIAVMDLMVLADALLLPSDDLALATVLKSPIFGLSEDDIFEIAWARPRTLREALRSKAQDKPQFAAANAALDRLAAWARVETPFAFYSHVLGPAHGRRKILARLGHEANDALDEFLNLALDYERRETPSLQGFIAWLREAQTDVKRDMEISRDEVRVMTVHGAKGLEAPIVILADTMTPPAGPNMRQPRVFELSHRDDPPDTPFRLAWAGRTADDVPALRASRDRVKLEAEHEYRRLLYVAMTRAAERLVICGADGKNARPPGCWYNLVKDTLVDLSREEPADDGDGNVWRYRKAAEQPLAARKQPELALQAPPPAWLSRDAPQETPSAILLAPSDTFDASARPSSSHVPAIDPLVRKRAMQRGTVIHRLLQALPEIPAERRADAARRFLARSAKDIDDHAQLAAEVTAVLDAPRFAPLFAPGSRAEVPIVGRIPRLGQPPLTISGQVDRLAVTADAVLIADYKTNRPAPRSLAEVPPAYLRQLALYRALLAKLYPGRIIRAALIWTDVPDLMEISSEAMDAAVAALTSP